MRFQVIATLIAAASLAAYAASSTDGGASSSADTTDVTADGGSADATTGDAGPADDGAADAGPTTATYAEEAPVIDDHCGSCHGSKFGTLAKVKQYRTKMLQVLEQGDMPQDDPSWGSTPDGQTLIDFLQSSPELQ